MQQKNNKSKVIETRVSRKEEESRLIAQLLAPTLFTPGTDDHLDHMLFKEKLAGKRVLSEDECTIKIAQEYRSHFTKEFYYCIADMYGVDRKLMDTYIKPFCAKFFTLQFIYARFPMKVLSRLFYNRKSQGSEGNGNKLHQYLTDIAIQNLEAYITQAIEVMKESKNIADFKIKYSKKYTVYYQLDMFTDLPS